MEFANAVRTVYSTGIEYISESFAPLTGAKLDAYVLLNGPTAEPIYEVVAIEPSAISRRGSRQFAIEFMIVTRAASDAIDRCHANDPRRHTQYARREHRIH